MKPPPSPGRTRRKSSVCSNSAYQSNNPFGKVSEAAIPRKKSSTSNNSTRKVKLKLASTRY